jgi:hypothetical protein
MKNSIPKKINRINYIVQENPIGVRKLLKVEGIEAPERLDLLINSTKTWIQQNGKEAIIKLLQEHPEKDAILSANNAVLFDQFDGCSCQSSFSGEGCGCKSSFSGEGCGCKSSFAGSGCKCGGTCSNYSGEVDNDTVVELLKGKKPAEVLAEYEELKRLSKKYPEDQEVKKELDLTWKYLSKTIKKKEDKPRDEVTPKVPNQPTRRNNAVFAITAKDLAVASFILGIALITSQIKS